MADTSGVGPDYGFLNNYVDRIIYGSKKPSDQPMIDTNDFYDTPQDDQEDHSDDIAYNLINSGTSEAYDLATNYLNDSQDDADEGSADQDVPEQSNGSIGSDEDDNETIYGAGETGSVNEVIGDDNPPGEGDGPVRYTITNGKLSSSAPVSASNKRLADKIAAKESNGKYTAYNPNGGGSGAVGKYQFRWNIWKDSIMKVTGVKTQRQFLNSPKAQEQYFSFYNKTVLQPQAAALAPYNKSGLTKDQLAQLIHFRGVDGAKKYLQGQVPDKPETYNSSISDYIGIPGIRQAGGIAVSPHDQYVGLNNPNYDEMLFPMEGVNDFRGLDNGDLVSLQDETGKKVVLKGPRDKAKMKGKVYEKRIK